MVSWSRYESMTERQRSQADTEMIMAQGRREVLNEVAVERKHKWKEEVFLSRSSKRRWGRVSGNEDLQVAQRKRVESSRNIQIKWCEEIVKSLGNRREKKECRQTIVYRSIERSLKSSIFHPAHFSQSNGWQKKVVFKSKVFYMPFRAHQLFHDKTLSESEHAQLSIQSFRTSLHMFKWTLSFTESQTMLLIM